MEETEDGERVTASVTASDGIMCNVIFFGINDNGDQNGMYRFSSDYYDGSEDVALYNFITAFTKDKIAIQREGGDVILTRVGDVVDMRYILKE